MNLSLKQNLLDIELHSYILSKQFSLLSTSVFVFKIKLNFGYCDPEKEKLFKITKINNFRGQLTDISAGKIPLLSTACSNGSMRNSQLLH